MCTAWVTDHTLVCNSIKYQQFRHFEIVTILFYSVCTLSLFHFLPLFVPLLGFLYFILLRLLYLLSSLCFSSMFSALVFSPPIQFSLLSSILLCFYFSMLSFILVSAFSYVSFFISPFHYLFFLSFLIFFFLLFFLLLFSMFTSYLSSFMPFLLTSFLSLYP